MIKGTTILSKAQTSLYRSLKQSKFRRQEGLFLLEGLRLCEEALSSELDIVACITVKNYDKLIIPSQLLHWEATSTQIQQISGSQTPQGVILVAKIPEAPPLPTPGAKKIWIAADRISDPGNLGTIFRTARWFGVNDILLGPGCVDPYNPKVVRGSMGAIAFLKIHMSDDLTTSALRWKESGGEVAALHMKGADLNQYHPESGLFLIVGSEAHGVSEELLSLSTRIAIKKPGQGESLNAAMALGIALYELSES